MGTRLLEGRDFDERDRLGGEMVVIINERMAKRYWPGGAVGRRLHRGVARPPFQWLRIVGVVEDVRQWAVDLDPRPEIYLPQTQFRGFYFVPQDLVIRAAGDPLAVAPAVRAIIRRVDPDQPITAIRPLEQTVRGALDQRRLQLFLFGGFAAAAWILACVGLYGVLATGVSQRTHEFGVRMALGARSGDLLKGVLRTGILLAASGMVAGWLAALLLTRFLSRLLYGITPTDPLTFVGGSVLMLGMALLASLLPARRATKVDPMVALRLE
jgi:predicted permease